MYKIFAAVACAFLLTGVVLLLPGMTPIDPVDAAQAYGKADRIDLRSYGPGCSERGWPYYEATCLRAADKADVKRVRVVTVDRLPDDVLLADTK